MDLDSDISELIEEQERIARRSRHICELLRERFKLHTIRSDYQPPPPALQEQHRLPVWQQQAPIPAKSVTRPVDGELREPLLIERADRRLSTQERNRIIHDKAAKKQELKACLADPLESPTERDLYHEDERMVVKIVSSHTFKNITLAIVVLNAIWIGVDTDYNHADFLGDAPRIFQIIENLFCAFFSFEVFLRFMSFKRKSDCVSDSWFVFDAVLVLLMVWDVWLMSLVRLIYNSGFHTAGPQALRILRLFRIMRVSRMARLLRSMPEFEILAKGFGYAVRSVCSTLSLLVVITYIFSVFFTQMLKKSDAGKGCFESVLMSMNCLTVNAVFADQANILDQVLKGGVCYYIFLMIFLVLSTITLLNMLIGVLCDLLGTTADAQREAHAAERVRDSVSKVLPAMDMDGDGMISQEEFRMLLDSPEAMSVISDLDVDVIALVDFAEYIFRGGEAISWETFMATIMKFRGEQKATVKDIVDMREFLFGEIAKLSTSANVSPRQEHTLLGHA